MIESRTARRFRDAYADLPEEARRQARQAYLLSRENPRHPSLRFKKVDEQSKTYSVRAGLGYRALGVMEGSTVAWFWIGSHAEYDRLLCGRARPATETAPPWLLSEGVCRLPAH